MPGGQGRHSRRGSSAELFAEFLIGRIAFTTRVAHQEDIGSDLHCVLKRLSGDMYVAEPYFFTIQTKVPNGKFEYKKEHSRKWVMQQPTPFFICLSDTSKLSISLYSTWNIHEGFLMYGHSLIKRVVLKPGTPINKEQPYVYTDGKLIVPLGRPILTIKAKDMVRESKMMVFADKLREWIRLDQKNIARRDLGIYWIENPGAYSVNGKFPPMRLPKLFINSANIQGSLQNIGRVGAQLKAELKMEIEDKQSSRAKWSSKIQALDDVLNSYYKEFDNEIRRKLKKIGLKVKTIRSH